MYHGIPVVRLWNCGIVLVYFSFQPDFQLKLDPATNGPFPRCPNQPSCVRWAAIPSLTYCLLFWDHETTMANTIYNGAISGERFVVGPQVSYGGTLNIHFSANRPGPVTACNKPFQDLPYPFGPGYIDRPVVTNWIQQKLNKTPSRAALIGIGGIGYVLMFSAMLLLKPYNNLRNADWYSSGNRSSQFATPSNSAKNCRIHTSFGLTHPQ